MPTFTVVITIRAASANEIDATCAALSARLPNLLTSTGGPETVEAIVDAPTSGEAVSQVTHRIDSLPPEIYGRLRISAKSAT